jgi:hypothetical protein
VLFRSDVTTAVTVVQARSSRSFEHGIDESCCGWIPFILETVDYELSENAPRNWRA